MGASAKLQVHFSSDSVEWETPQALFEKLDAEFHFELDVCATPKNAKCDRFFTKEQDGLEQEWRGVCWMNPPYGDPEFPCKQGCTKKKCIKRGSHCLTYVPGIRDWMSKASHAAYLGAIVVCLVPSRTDTRWWHESVMPVLEGKRPGKVTFVPGRIKFNGHKNSAPFPSAIVVFQPPTP